MSKNERFCFCRDESGHDYLIPFELRKEFDDLVMDDDYKLFKEKFGGMRTGQHPSLYSFTDPHCDVE